MKKTTEMVTARAGVYVRISEDRDGTEKAVQRQERDCRALAKRLGWRVGQVYVENDVSAFKRRRVRLPDGSTAMRVVRPEFRRLLDDLMSGVTDGVIVYNPDRLARDSRDLEDFLDAIDEVKAPTASVTGALDLSNDTGRTVARIMTAIANQSSRDSSRRLTRFHEDLAEQGKFGGGSRAFGYEADGRHR